MTLQEKLNAYKARFKASAPPEIQEIMHRATEDLRRSGILERTVKVGDKAPAFALPNAAGLVVRSEDLLAKGPLVVRFYRGMVTLLQYGAGSSTRGFAGHLDRNDASRYLAPTRARSS